MIRRIVLLLASMVLAAPATAQSRPPVVLAAASLQESMNAAADAWAKRGNVRPTLSFAASSALARQAAAGAPADLFVSADVEWMDDLDKRGLLAKGSRVNLLGNRLVLIAPVDSRVRVTLRPGVDLRPALNGGRLAMADPDAVPAGRYSKAALTALRGWDAVTPSVVRAENVRAALALVERGAAPLGIVYATDAKASAKVRVVGLFPTASHPPITYPIARLKASRNVEGERFRRFLVSPAGRAIFVAYGFSPR